VLRISKQSTKILFDYVLVYTGQAVAELCITKARMQESISKGELAAENFAAGKMTTTAVLMRKR